MNKRANFENTKRSAASVGPALLFTFSKEGQLVSQDQILGGQRFAAAEKPIAEADALRNCNLAGNSQPRKLPERAQHAAIVSQLSERFHYLIGLLRTTADRR